MNGNCNSVQKFRNGIFINASGCNDNEREARINDDVEILKLQIVEDGFQLKISFLKLN